MRGGGVGTCEASLASGIRRVDPVLLRPGDKLDNVREIRIEQDLQCTSAKLS